MICDSGKVKLYIRFQEAYKLDERLGKKLDFKFGSVEYWRIATQYIETHSGNIRLGNSLFSYYYIQLHPEIKKYLI